MDFFFILFSITAVIAQISDENSIGELAKKRLDLLIEGDTTNASFLYAEDFELINPVGETFTKMKYLSEVASGLHDYLTFNQFLRSESDEMGNSPFYDTNQELKLLPGETSFQCKNIGILTYMRNGIVHGR